MIVLDANVLIALLDDEDVHHGRAMGVLTELADRPLAASAITVAEVLVEPVRTGRLIPAQTALEGLVTELALTPGSAARLAALRVTTQLRLPDCAVLLAAADVDAEAIVTFDDRLRQAAGEIGVSVR